MLRTGSGGYLVAGISSLKHRTQHISLHPELGASGAVPMVLVCRGGGEPGLHVRSQDGPLRLQVEHSAFGLGRPKANDSTGHVLTGRGGDIVARSTASALSSAARASRSAAVATRSRSRIAWPRRRRSCSRRSPSSCVRASTVGSVDGAWARRHRPNDICGALKLGRECQRLITTCRAASMRQSSDKHPDEEADQ